MVYHHAQHSRKSSTNLSHYTKSGLAPCGSTPPFSFLDSCDFACSKSCDVFNFFDFPTFQLNITHSSTFLSPNLHRPTLVASYAPSDPPEPPFTSVLCGCCRLLSLPPNLDSGEEILALRSSATSQQRTYYCQPPPTPPTS